VAELEYFSELLTKFQGLWKSWQLSTYVAQDGIQIWANIGLVKKQEMKTKSKGPEST
jgi:hypothetical protein